MATQSVDLLRQVEDALGRISRGALSEAASHLLSILGYQSDRVPPQQTGVAADFITQFPAENPNNVSEQNFLAHDPTVQILFQVTDDEIAFPSQQPLLGRLFDIGVNRSFVFASVDLRGETYPRSEYSKLTREINKRLSQPTVVLFRTTAGMLTVAFMERRPDKRIQDRDVLGKVSLIREVNSNEPHQAHMRILGELALHNRLDWMQTQHKPANFDGLLTAWLDCLDTEELNKKFYQELFRWFENATQQARFPTAENPTTEEHIIRLITRLLFIWFIKEKGLVHPDLFIQDQVRLLLRDYDSQEGDSYYRAVLQNLFFATLNTEIDQRGFSDSASTDFSHCRYREEVADPDSLLELLSETPFINGGLFDCLDSDDDQGLIDCFSDNLAHRNLLSVPNRLFFGPEGLVTLFNRYRFTVEENTPIEQDVALDPELLGKVFENLLAAFNPETRETARKQTGSYYTPREVVDYMVTEALVAYWTETVQDDFDDKIFWEERLRYLLDYSDDIDDANTIFESVEQERLIENIAHIRVLDPAVGSGAFPMALLHRVTLALSRLDPDNIAWRGIQQHLAVSRVSQAFEIEDKDLRESILLRINDTFERYQSSFGRKLFLIQNSIYGIDIQPIACQIAKLRTFISLAIEQQPNNDPDDNYGIRPLPNLESNFVAADTLIGLKGQARLASPHAVDLRRKWATNTEQHFHATTRRRKQALIREDRILRADLAHELRNLGMPADHTNKIAHWDRYNQNTSADWFDSQYMFNVTQGFDIVIGNPPYIQLQDDGGRLGKKYQKTGYTTFTKSGDIYVLFYEKGCQLLKPAHGVLAYITSNSWMKTLYGGKLRKYLSDQHTPLTLLEMGKDVFDAVVDTNILLVRRGRVSRPFPAVDRDAHRHAEDFPPPAKEWGQVFPYGTAPWSIFSTVEKRVLDKMTTYGTPLGRWNISINYGIKTGYNKAFIIGKETRDALIAMDSRSGEILKPVLQGRDIDRYRASWRKLYLVATHNGYDGRPAVDINEYPAVKNHLNGFYRRLAERYDKGHTPYNLRSCAYYGDFEKPKLFWTDLTDNGRFYYDETGIYGEATTFIMTATNPKYLCALLNSRLATWFLQHSAPTSGTGTFRWKKAYVETIPIPEPLARTQLPLVEMVDSILAAKKRDPSADTRGTESQIDRMVYDLYDLTAAEVSAVETRLLAIQ